jgi:hypothetical protein
MKLTFTFSPVLMSRLLKIPAAALLAASLFLTLPQAAHATVDDSHSQAMEGAVEAVKAGFKVRQEYWKGTVKSGEQKIVKQQLFKGNEYWFFLGTDSDDVTLKVDVYDKAGTKINVETKVKENSSAVRVLAPATGTYMVVFSLTTKEGEEIPWALAYGYR